MNRALLITLAALGGGGLLVALIFIPRSVTVSNAGDNTAALYHPASQISSTSSEELQADDEALTLPTDFKDASTESPMDTSHVSPSARVAPGIPSATSSNSFRVPVVTYHTLRVKEPGHGKHGENTYNVPPDLFEKELVYLRDNSYTSITYQDIVDARANKKPLPSKPVMLTFDDGLIDHYTVALPVLKKYNMRGIFYIYPNPIDHKNKKWMSWDQVKALKDAGMEIGSHTYTHPRLERIVAPTWDKQKALLNKEIDSPKHELEEKLGIHVLSIAYPFGLYNARVIGAVQKSGYQFGRTISPGIWQDPAHNLEWGSQILTDNFKLFTNYLARQS